MTSHELVSSNEGESALGLRVGVAHLAASGILNVVSGLLLISWRGSDRVLRVVLAGLRRVVTDVTALALADEVVALVTIGLPVLGTILVAVGGLQLYGSRTAYMRRHRTRCLLAAGLGICNPFSAPLSFIAASLFYLDTEAFVD